MISVRFICKPHTAVHTSLSLKVVYSRLFDGDFHINMIPVPKAIVLHDLRSGI